MTNETKQVKLHSRGGAKRLARIALFTALMAVCAQISIPLPGGVPITLQTLAVMLASIALGFDGVAAVAVYVFLGLIGVPVFYKFGATASLVSPTGGYIVGFLPMSALMATIIKTFEKRSENSLKPAEKRSENSLKSAEKRGGARRYFLVFAIASLLGTIVCYTFGSAWLIGLFALKGVEKSIGSVLSVCVVPFILPDLLKIALASYLGAVMRKTVRKNA